MKRLLSVIVLLFGMSIYGYASSESIDMYESARKCKGCHKEIYNQWTTSRHSKSVQTIKKATSSKCLKCHAPLTVIAGDSEIKDGIQKEGITCDFCHSIKGLSKTKTPIPFIMEPGKRKKGPFGECGSSFHEVEYSELHTSSELCTGCHQIGTPIFKACVSFSDSRWEDSSYAKKGSQCQDCHMSQYKGKAAVMGKTRDNLHSHTFPGAYSEEQLKKAAGLNIDVTKKNGKINLIAKITNSGAGHLLPIGYPLRMVILKIESIDSNGDVIWTNWKEDPIKEDRDAIFMKMLGDDSGNAPVAGHAAKKIVMDTRIKPNETKTVTYVFDAGSAERVVGKLFFRLVPSSVAKKKGITDEYILKSHLIARVEKSL